MAKQIELYSTEQAQMANFNLEVDANGEILATREDNDGSEKDEMVKFPAGLSKEEFLEQVQAYNEANQGEVALTDIALEHDKKVKASEDLLEDL